MRTANARLSATLLGLFVLSGFAGLIYQSVWSHYLGLTLGHAAYAQTLVLAIFMGGMALGAAWASRVSVRWGRLLLGYAVIEAAIGVAGLLFHPVFVAYSGWSSGSVLPALQSPWLAHLYGWTTCALLILPQCVLLGATFPLMSAGLLRALPGQDNEVLGGLYFTNSLGAALGAICSTFVLIPAIGLPGAVHTAGLLNLLVALIAWRASRSISTPAPVVGEAGTGAAKAGDPQDAAGVRRLGRVVLVATAASGAASFVYEIGWIRLLNQALGSTVHSFELMLAAFILGLAFGGLWIRRRARRIADPIAYAGYAQVFMGIAALLSIPVFASSFGWVGWLIHALSKSEQGYRLFELGTAGISLLVMFPAAFFAGMTLPLFTAGLLRSGADERAIGRVYAANTLGAIAGVFLMTHVLIPAIGVRLSVSLAALADIVIGFYLLRFVSPGVRSPKLLAVAGVVVAAFGFSSLAGRPDPVEQASGVFRTGNVRLEGAKVGYLRDGKTATVSVFATGSRRVIATNGKPDAALAPMDERPSSDEHTMVMLGAAPLALHPSPERIAVIGWGSGLTTHTLLGSHLPKSVETIEIEPAMVEGARLFGANVARAYDDPRSILHIDDARTYLATSPYKYDVIVSEPSNPWVSGVASLFTREFYRFLRGRIEDDGMLVQWLHAYEIDDPLVATMMSALLAEFPHTEVYLTNHLDFLIIARANAPTGGQVRVPRDPQLAAELRRVGLEDAQAFAVRRMGGETLLSTYVRMFEATPHSDYFPVVSLRAPVTRFRQAEAGTLISLVNGGMPVLDLLDCRQPVGSAYVQAPVRESTLSLSRARALEVVASLRQGAATPGLIQADAPTADSIASILTLPLATRGSQDVATMRLWTASLSIAAATTIGHLPADDLRDIWTPDAAWLPAGAAAMPEVQAVMEAYRAAAARDLGTLGARAEAVLQLDPKVVAPPLREQMLVLAMTAAAAVDDDARVRALEDRYGGGADMSKLLTGTRVFALAWADGNRASCHARRSGAPR